MILKERGKFNGSGDQDIQEQYSQVKDWLYLQMYRICSIQLGTITMQN
jgi:hypothetical protein